jgi:hypothetical protein
MKQRAYDTGIKLSASNNYPIQPTAATDFPEFPDPDSAKTETVTARVLEGGKVIGELPLGHSGASVTVTFSVDDSLSVTKIWESLFETWTSSSAHNEPPPVVVETARLLLSSVTEDDFEDDAETDYPERLTIFVRQYGDLAVDALRDVLMNSKLEPIVAAETLKSLARIHDFSTHWQRRRLLEFFLKADSRYVRDGAILGLSIMNDPAAIRSLERAWETESISRLRERTEQVVEKLRRIRQESRR